MVMERIEMTDKSTKIDVRRNATADTPAARRGTPFEMLRQEVDRIFDDFAWPGFDFPAMRSRWLDPHDRHAAPGLSMPSIDLVERSGEFEVQAELPGIGADDIEVKVSGGALFIKGEKTAQHEEKDENRHISERSYGAFQRMIRLPDAVDLDKIAAEFKDGVLRVRIPKTEEARKSERKVEIKAA